MPINWIERTFQPVLTAPADQLRLFPVWLLLGPRQVGKSSLLHKCAGGHAYVDLDDLTTRERANRDPALFVRELRPPFTIDEIQYAPDLLSPIKQLVDAGDLEVQVHFWRTRDGQEIDFLVENDGKTFPVEVKLGSPRYAALPALDRIAGPGWQEGQVVSLVAGAEPVRLREGWSLCAPGALNVGGGGAAIRRM